MPEKSANLAWVMRPNPIVHSWFKILTMGVFLGILIVWSIDGLNTNTFQKDFAVLKNLNTSETLPFVDSSFRNVSVAEPSLENHLDIDLNFSTQILAQTHENLEIQPKIARNVSNFSPKVSVSRMNPRVLQWISSDLEANYSSKLLMKWLTPGGEPCRDSKSVDIRIPNLDGKEKIELNAGEIHEFVFQTVNETGEFRCLGGDYFETDLSGERWKSRPPIKDAGNGTYKFSLQVHPDFSGDYNLTIILLFRHYEGLKFSTAKFVFDKIVRQIPIKFVKSKSPSARLPILKQCDQKSDFSRDVWSGRWTRHAKNDNCSISRDGRYRCINPGFPCKKPWCEGPLGSLESNGWVYSSHCSFKLVSSEEAWNCLAGRWIFWWGDSNHCDTIRNILHFVLGVNDIPVVPRIFDQSITNPKNASQTVRFTSIFNGHFNHTGNYQGLNSLINEEYRATLTGFFSGKSIPDTLIMNSGLHDGIFWKNIRRFIKGADFAAAFWARVMEGVDKRGLARPEIIYRTTITTGGYARALAFNPQKMEAFNGVVLDKLRRYGVLDKVIDDFDMTYPWHYDNRCNDGVHYGRAPLRARWRDGLIGHQYFVDLMLGHVLVNALCARSV